MRMFGCILQDVVTVNGGDRFTINFKSHMIGDGELPA